MVQMHEFWWCRVGGLECRYLAFFFFSRADQLPLSSAQLTIFLHFKSSCLSLFLPQLSSLKVLFLSITFGFITNAHNYHHNERAHAALEHSMLNWSLGGSFVCTQVHAINSTYKLKYALNSQLQALQILTNDDEVENWCLSSFLLAVNALHKHAYFYMVGLLRVPLIFTRHFCMYQSTF